MSKVTLDDLRRDFEAAMSHWRTRREYETAEWVSEFMRTDGRYLLSETVDDELRNPHTRAFKTAETYLIARDHGLDAAMLYKLSDGNIDPRKP